MDIWTAFHTAEDRRAAAARKAFLIRVAVLGIVAAMIAIPVYSTLNTAAAGIEVINSGALNHPKQGD